MSNESLHIRTGQVPTSTKTRNWCFTLNNPTEEDRSFFSSLQAPPRGMEYIILQEERGEQETVHFQGYLETTTTHNINWLKNNFNSRAHFEPRRGTQEEAIAYCRKEETRVPGGISIELGTRRPGITGAAQKKQERLDALDAIRAKRLKLSDISSELALHQGFLSAATHFTKTMLGPHRENMQIITIIGGTGIGKSYAAYRLGGSSIITYQRNGWFGGADTEGDVLLFDEFTGNIPLSEFLKLLDGYPNQLPVKGAFYPAFYTKVFITSNVMPEHWWTNKDEEAGQKRLGELDCLYRRIGYMGPNGEHPEYDNGKFIVVPEFDEKDLPITKNEKRKILHQKLLDIGFDVRDPEEKENNQQPQQEDPTTPNQEPLTQAPKPLDQMDIIFNENSY